VNEPSPDASPRVAAVTGASSGIGRAIAEALGALGWKVAIGARRTDLLAETAAAVRDAGGEPLVHPLDVTDAASVDTFFEAAEGGLGTVDVLVNNAGIAVPGPFHEIEPDDLEREVRTNLLGPMLCARRAVARLLSEGSPGDVVFVSSDTSRQARPWMVGYSATKAAVETVARALGLELEGTGIRTTTVRVGPTLTDFANTWDPGRIDVLMQGWPRFGIQRHFQTMQPSDVARAVVLAVTTPRGVHLDTIEIQPEAPPPG
jgi:NAD(P)-dependent dehydrogenase (short-subunit alcohol dehydrogenase family)